MEISLHALMFYDSYKKRFNDPTVIFLVYLFQDCSVTATYNKWCTFCHFSEDKKCIYRVHSHGSDKGYHCVEYNGMDYEGYKICHFANIVAFAIRSKPSSTSD